MRAHLAQRANFIGGASIVFRHHLPSHRWSLLVESLNMIPDSNSPDRQQGQETQLSRTLRLRDLTMLIVGTVIGSGIFLVPGKVLYEVKLLFSMQLL